MNVTLKVIATTAIVSALAAGLAYAQTGENNTPMRGGNEVNSPRDGSTTTDQRSAAQMQRDRMPDATGVPGATGTMSSTDREPRMDRN